MKIVVREVGLSLIPLTFKKPFKFGDYTLTACPQLFTKVLVEVDGKRRSSGMSAEMAVPRWFDKRLEVSPSQNIADLQRAVSEAGRVCLSVGNPLTVAELHTAMTVRLQAECVDLPALVQSFGVAQVEKAVIDALCRCFESSFADATRADLWGLASSSLCKDFPIANVRKCLGALKPRSSLFLRHTVGFSAHSSATDEDAEMVALANLVRTQKLRYLKIKLSGSLADDIKRVALIMAAFAEQPLPAFTLDCNEQYRDKSAVLELCRRVMDLEKSHNTAVKHLLYIEQPFAREVTLGGGFELHGCPVPAIIDESDDTDDAFLQSLSQGYTGVSSKACKGVLRALGNVVRCHLQNDSGDRALFVSPEDLCTQPGWALHQDLALAALTGSAHVEKNGHQYVEAFENIPKTISTRFPAEHHDLYVENLAAPSLRIERGTLFLSSVNYAKGFGTSVGWGSIDGQMPR